MRPARISGRSAHLAALLVWTAAVGACQPLPHPFQPEGKAAALEGHLEPGPRAGLVVTRPDGLSERSAERLAALVAANLRDRGVAATAAASERRRYRLHGRIGGEGSPSAASGHGPGTVLRWSLVDPDGDVVGTAVQNETAAAAAGDLSETELAAIAARAAPRIDRLLDAIGDSPPPTRPLDAVVVYRVDGAPGNGGATLRREMQNALRMRRVPVVENLVDDAYVVLGAVDMDEGPAPGQQTVRIDWTVIRPDGRRVGSIFQRNTVEAGRLDGAWGTVAAAAASGAAEGVASLLESVGTDRRKTPGKR